MAFAPEIAGTGMGFGGGGYADDELPPQAAQMQQRKGVAFQTDLGSVGGSGTKGPFGGAAKNIEAEERRLIDKVFNLVDRDGSGQIDITELTGMFAIFGIESQFISSAIARVMNVVDKDKDNMITPSEFYGILSQRFEKGDSMKDIESVFHKMDKDRDNKLSVDELHDVSIMLGENSTKAEIEDMIKVFSRDYQSKMREHNASRKKDRKDVSDNPERKKDDPPPAPTFLDLNDFYEAMQGEFKTFGADLQNLMMPQAPSPPQQ